jgi:GNAT superfamily N-acetyltransferase
MGVNSTYSYDLQVTRFFQGTGLGKTLMRQLANIGSAWKMEKVMLTVFKGSKDLLRSKFPADVVTANTRAFQFYNSTG